MKEILKSLASAKSEIGAISKSDTNPFFKSKYFDINTLVKHVEPILEAHGLMLMQPIKDGKVTSIIYHVASGELIESEMILPVLNDPQKMGSAITYYRRYTLQSLLALQAEDDDGNLAAKPLPPKKEQLTDEGFQYLITKGSKDEISIALKDRHMTQAQSKVLNGIKNGDSKS